MKLSSIKLIADVDYIFALVQMHKKSICTFALIRLIFSFDVQRVQIYQT